MREIWKDIIGFEGLYQVSNRGRVKSCLRMVPHPHGALTIREKLLKELQGPYPRVKLSKGGRGKGRPYRIHGLVLNAFVGPKPEGLEARHLNDNPKDNRWPENLVWGTHKQNVADLIRNGGSQRRNTKDQKSWSGALVNKPMWL
jgi:hypothetical protein